MSNTTKERTGLDGNQTLQHAFNDVDSSITINGFLTGKVGRKITVTLATTTVTDDTEEIEFLEGAASLYTLRLIYTDGSRDILISAERIA